MENMNSPANTTANVTTRQQADVAAVKRNSSHFHPLEIIPWFRRYKYTWWRDIIYTFIWNNLIGLAFAAVGFTYSGKVTAGRLANSLLFANCIGYIIHVLFIVSSKTFDPWVSRQSRTVITLYYAAVSTLGAYLGYFLAASFLGADIWQFFSPELLLSVTVTSLIISLIIGAIYFWRERSLLAEMSLERERLRVATIEREATLANLRTLQAQIEPHFLFNTLANVVSLIHPEPDTAKRMLESFIEYLRASLDVSRQASITLEKEFELMRHYLSLLQIRMGGRLKVTIDLPQELAGQELPPMLIQPLVENAIRHGLEPNMDGGAIALSARRDATHLRIVVANTGLGFSGAKSSGIGLHNVKERLAALYGSDGSLEIEENAPSGTRVIIKIPTLV